MTPQEVWEQVAAHQRERWREHVADALPEALLERLETGPEGEQ